MGYYKRGSCILMRWLYDLDLGDGLDDIGIDSVYQCDTLTDRRRKRTERKQEIEIIYTVVLPSQYILEPVTLNFDDEIMPALSGHSINFIQKLIAQPAAPHV